MRKKFIYIVLFTFMLLTVCSCDEAANVQQNIAQDSNNFHTYREVTFINLRTDSVLLQVEGYISIKNSATDELAVIIQTGDNEYMMHYLYIGGEVVYLVEQKEYTYTDPHHWEIRLFATFPEVHIED